MKRFSKNDIEEIVEILKNDGVISVPTDTVYGICGSSSSIKVRNKIVSIKQRPELQPIAIMCSDIEQIKKIAIVDDKVEKIIKKFMPGPITLILKKRKEIPDYFIIGSAGVGIRMATSKELKEIIEKLGCPIFLSSANKAGEPTCTNLDEIEKACPDLDGMLDGEITFGEGSTIIDCISSPIKILREGPIKLEEILKVIE